MALSPRWCLLPLLLCLVLLCRAEQPALERPVVRAGILDLEPGSLGPGNSLYLNGEWEFYWNRLIYPGEFKDETGARDFIQMPGAWNGHPSANGPLPADGFATYRLRIRSPRFSPNLALKVPTMHSAFLLFVNGRRMAANGHVGPQESWSQPAYHPLVTPVLATKSELEIVIQISNFHHRKGGTWTGIKLGRASDLHREREEGLLIDFLLLGSLLIMGFYHLLLYVFRRGRDHSPLYLGIFCLLVSVRILATGEHYLGEFFPELPWEYYVKIQYLSYYLCVPVWALFVRVLFPRQFPRIYVHVIFWPVLVCSIWVMLFPVRSFSYSMDFFQIFTVALGLMLVVILIQAALRREDGVWLFLTGWIMFFATIINDILQNLELIQSVTMVPLGVFGFILVQSAMLSRRFSRAFDVAERLSEDLEAGIRKRTAELHASRDELREARDRAEESSRAKSEFLAAMSHEIRTPLNSILGTAGLLQEVELEPEQNHQVNILNRAGARLLNLINEVLDLSRIESGKQVLEEIPYDPVKSCQELLGILEQRAREKDIELTFTVADDFPRAVLGDPIRLEQVLLNLLGNALKFTERGSIELSLKARNTSLGEPRLEFAVRDTGIGIPAAKMPVIFESFIQVDQAPTRRYEGSGLGLAISKRLVNLMGGDISVSSRPGHGSEFRFVIPYTAPGVDSMRETAQAAGDSPAASVEDALRNIKPGTRLLLVEDNEDNRYLVEAYLARAPLELTVAENGEQAVARVRDEEFDLVLMDIQMPVMDGYQATRVIRSYEEETGRPPVPIVALTANATMEAVRRSQQAGCNDHLTKPIEKYRLLDIIARYSDPSSGQS